MTRRALSAWPLCLLLACNRGGLPDPDEPAADLGGAADLARAPDLAPDAGLADLAGQATCGTERESVLLRDRSQIGLPRLVWAKDRYAAVWYDDSRGGFGSREFGAFFGFASPEGVLDSASVRPVPTAVALAAFPRVAWSGTEFGLAYIGGPTRQAHFVRLDAAGAVIAGSDVALGAALDGLALAWNGTSRQWAVAWVGASDLTLARLSAAGAPLGSTVVTSGGIPNLAATGRSPLLWNGASYAIAYRGGGAAPAQVAEIDADGKVLGRVDVSDGQSLRLDLAWDGAGYGVARTDTSVSPPQIRFVRVEGGRVVPGTDRALGAPGQFQGEAAIAWDGVSFNIVWAASTTMPAESRIFGARLGPGGDVREAPRPLGPSYGWWPSVEWNGCQLAVPYVYGQRSEEARVLLLPGPRPLG